MRQALHAEWTKLRTLASGGWLVLGAIASTLALSAAACAVVRYTPVSFLDTTKLSLTGIYLGQGLIAILGVAVISGELSTCMIQATLTAMPRRTTVLAAKAAVVGGLALVAGTISVGCCLLFGRLVLPDRGFTAAHGYQLLSLAHEATLRAAGGSVVYLVLIALLSLGITTAVRDSAASIGVVLGLLYLFPIVAGLVRHTQWQRHLQQIGPMSAGLSIQATTSLHSLPIGPWAGLGVLSAWAAVALLVGGLALQLRDA